MNISFDQIESLGAGEANQADQIRSRLHDLRGVIPILIVYFCLAFYHIGHQSLWVDEVISVQVATQESFFSPVIWFRQSPLYFALLHVWAKLGTSEIALRSLSAIFGGIAVCLMYIVGLKLFNQRIAWIGTTILATSPFFIWYSQEVRYITLMIVTSLFSMYAFYQALASDRREWWFSYCLSLIVATAAFISNVFLPFVQGLFVLCSPSHRPLLRKVLICQFVFFAVFVWWANGGQLDELGGRWQSVFNQITLNSEDLSSIPRKERLSSGGHRDFELAAVPYTFFTFSTGFSMGPSVRDLQVSRSINTLRPYAPLLLTLALLFGGLCILGLPAVWRRPDAGIFLILWLGVPIIGASAISALTDMAYNVRYVSMALPAYIMIVAFGISCFKQNVIQMALLIAVLLVNAGSLNTYYADPGYAREDARSAAAYLQSKVNVDDTILVIGSPVALRYYYRGSVPIISVKNTTLKSDATEFSQGIKRIGKNSGRIWAVEIRRWKSDRKGNVRKVLEQLYERLEYHAFPGVEIYLYDVNPSLRLDDET